MRKAIILFLGGFLSLMLVFFIYGSTGAFSSPPLTVPAKHRSKTPPQAGCEPGGRRPPKCATLTPVPSATFTPTSTVVAPTNTDRKSVV